MWHQTIASRPTRVVTELNLLLQQNLNTFRYIPPQVFFLKHIKGIKKQRTGRAPLLASAASGTLGLHQGLRIGDMGQALSQLKSP